MDYTAFYAAPLIPVGVLLATLLLLLIVPVFAVAALAALLLAGVAVALAMAGAIVAAPVLLIRELRRRTGSRRQRTRPREREVPSQPAIAVPSPVLLDEDPFALDPLSPLP